MAAADHVQMVGVFRQFAAQAQIAQHHVDGGVGAHRHYVRVHQATGAVLVVGQHLLQTLAVLAVHRLQDSRRSPCPADPRPDPRGRRCRDPRPPRPARPGPCPRSGFRARPRRRAPAPHRRPRDRQGPRPRRALPGGRDSSRLPISAGDSVLTSRLHRDPGGRCRARPTADAAGARSCRGGWSRPCSASGGVGRTLRGEATTAHGVRCPCAYYRLS